MRWKFPIGRGGKSAQTGAESAQPTAPAAARKRPKPGKPQWWEWRRAHNTKPSTYTCPICHQLLPALSDHMLLFPEGDHGRRRHAHTACVLKAREEGRLPSRDEWLRAQR